MQKESWRYFKLVGNSSSAQNKKIKKLSVRFYVSDTGGRKCCMGGVGVSSKRYDKKKKAIT